MKITQYLLGQRQLSVLAKSKDAGETLPGLQALPLANYISQGSLEKPSQQELAR